jgi:hypothetical protein
VFVWAGERSDLRAGTAATIPGLTKGHCEMLQRMREQDPPGLFGIGGRVSSGLKEAPGGVEVGAAAKPPISLGHWPCLPPLLWLGCTVCLVPKDLMRSFLRSLSRTTFDRLFIVSVMNGVISDHTAHPSVTTSSGAFCGDYTTYSTSVLSKRHPRK